MKTDRVFYLEFVAGSYDCSHYEWSSNLRHLVQVVDEKTNAAKVLGLTSNHIITEYALTKIPSASEVK